MWMTNEYVKVSVMEDAWSLHNFNDNRSAETRGVGQAEGRASVDAWLCLQGLSLLSFQRPEASAARAHAGPSVMELRLLQQSWSVRGWVNLQTKR